MPHILRSSCDKLDLVFVSPSPIGENALFPWNTLSPSAPSTAKILLDSFNASALGASGEPIPIGFEVRLQPIDPERAASLFAFYDLMMQALCQFAMSDYESQTYPQKFHQYRRKHDEYAMTVHGLSSTSPAVLSTIKTKLALWGLLHVLERIAGPGMFTAVKASFYIDGGIVGELHFDQRNKFSPLGIGTDPLIEGNNTAVESHASLLVLASDPDISIDRPTTSKAIQWPSTANLTPSSLVGGKYGRMELIPRYGRFLLNLDQIMVSYARALAIGGLAIPPKSDRPPPSIKFDQHDLQTSVSFDKAAPMTSLPVWTYEWIITAISHVVNEMWEVAGRGLYSCVYDVKVDGILLGYVGIGPLR